MKKKTKPGITAEAVLKQIGYDNFSKKLEKKEYDFVDLCANDIVAVNKGGKFSEEGDFFEGGLWGYYDLVKKKEIVAPQYNQ